MSNTITIRFDASLSVVQTLRMLADIDSDDLLVGLEKGIYATTIGHGDEPSMVVESATGNPVAEIEHQESGGESNYDEFILSEE